MGSCVLQFRLRITAHIGTVWRHPTGRSPHVTAVRASCLAICIHNRVHKHKAPLYDRCPACERQLRWPNLYRWRCRCRCGCGLHLSEMDSYVYKSLPSYDVDQAALVSADLIMGNLSIDKTLNNLAIIIRPGSLCPARLKFGVEDRASTIPWIAAASSSLIKSTSRSIRRYSRFLEEKVATLNSGNALKIEMWRTDYVNPFTIGLNPSSNSTQTAKKELYAKPSFLQVLPGENSGLDRVASINKLLSPRDVARLLKIRTGDVYRLAELEVLHPKNLAVRNRRNWIFDWMEIFSLVSKLSEIDVVPVSGETISLADLIRRGELTPYNCDPALILVAVLRG